MLEPDILEVLEQSWFMEGNESLCKQRGIPEVGIVRLLFDEWP